MSFKAVENFECQIASFFGSPYAVATDCCTHAVELCLRRAAPQALIVPTRTYISIPFFSYQAFVKANMGIARVERILLS